MTNEHHSRRPVRKTPPVTLDASLAAALRRFRELYHGPIATPSFTLDEARLAEADLALPARQFTLIDDEVT